MGFNGLRKKRFTTLLTDIFVCWGPALILKGLSHLVCVFYEWKDPAPLMVDWFREKGV